MLRFLKSWKFLIVAVPLGGFTAVSWRWSWTIQFRKACAEFVKSDSGHLLGIVALGMLVATSWSWLPRWASPARVERWDPTRRLVRLLGKDPPRRLEWAHRAAMTLCAGLGIWAFTLFGQMHDHGAFGHQNFHAHDCYHYYFGSKYLKEWGYDRMYLATVTALEEVGKEEPRKTIHFDRIRDLRGSARFLRRDDFLPLAADAKARFSPERWKQLKADLSFLREKTMDNNWWSGVVLDSGFNPPPSYAVMSSTLSNAVPFNESTWKFLGAFDFALLAVGIVAIGFALGPMPALFAPVILGNTPITTYNWTGGSFLRQLWLFFLMIGLSLLVRRRWGWAGAALGACVASVFFPVFFLFGALVPLGYLWHTKRTRTAVFKVAAAATITVSVLVSLATIRFGMEPWHEWSQRIGAHSVSFFDNHVSLKKVTTFAPEVAPQAFGAGDNVYPDWNHALVARLQMGHWADVLLALVLSALAIGGALRSRPAEAALVAGSGLLVYWTMPAGYYTIYIGVFAAFLLANRRSDLARARFSIVCVALAASIFLQHYQQDRILHSITLSLGWILCISILSALNWIERPAIAQTLAERKRTVTVLGVVALALLGIGALSRDILHDASFLPPEVQRGGRVLDVLDVGVPASEQGHGMDIGETLRVPRKYLDVNGYRIQDECGILRKGRTMRYTFGPLPHAGRLIVRTDSFYKGELLTKINGRSMPAAVLDPRQTIFTYLEIPLPADLGDGPIKVEQETNATDVGMFTVWLVDDQR
jgi:hypothetical protein